MAQTPIDLAELRRLAAEWGLPVDSLVGRLTLRVDEVAKAVGVSVRTVQGWVSNGRLTASKPDRVLLIPLADVLRLLEETRVRPPGVSDTRSKATQLIRGVG